MRSVTVVVLAVVLSVFGAIGLVRGGAQDELPSASPPVTTDLVPTDGSQDLTGLVESLQERLRRLPEDSGSWAALGLAYVEQARVTGDPSYYDKADQAVAASLAAQDEVNAAARAAAAALAAARHDFSGALAEADAALKVDPYDPTALAVRIDALTELGRYDDQWQALRVADRRQPGVPVAARYSYAYELRGRLRRAAEILDVAAAVGSHADRAFLFTLHAELDRRDGELRSSARYLRRALDESPSYLPAIVSRARLAVADGRPQVAARLWERVVARLPLPEYLIELGELYLHLDRPDLAETQFSVVQSTVDLLSRSEVNTDLETALFQADHGDPGRALASARTEWQRRQSIHVADVLAWALHANGQDRAALRLSRQATRLGTAEARLWLHRGTIEAALGLDAAAREHLRHGLGVDPGASPWQADRARAVLRSIGGGS